MERYFELNMDHLNLLLEIASLKASELLRELQLYCNSQSPAAEATYGTGPRCAMVSKLKESYAKFEGIETLIRRVYLHDDELGGYCRVGWVVSGEVERCMLCSGRFSLMRMRHHCRACGNVICGLCAPSKVFIEELTFAGPQLVCTQCDHGQVIRINFTANAIVLFFPRCFLPVYVLFLN